MGNMGDLNKVWEIKALKRKDEEEKARNILQRIAKQVQPIMRKHNWRVKLLSEFCPKNPSLLGLNVNHGVHVKLRLRRPNRDSEFYPYDQVLDTMLHELCHNAHGPHNAVFYKLWDELRKECEELMTKGVTGSGEGFDLPGKRLGGFSRQPPISSLRRTALAAAQKRERLGSLLPSGPKRLGGDTYMMAALSPIQAAAMAAERRLQDEIWCASGSCEIEEAESSNDLLQNHVGQIPASPRSCSVPDGHKTNVISRKRNHESGSSSQSTLVDLTMDSLQSELKPNGCYLTKKRNYLSEKSNLANGHQDSNFIDLSSNVATPAAVYQVDTDYTECTTWECVTCTLVNQPLAPICEVCSTPKPKDVEDKYKFWSCKFCTLENGVKLEKCTACGQWRYSHGAPIAAPAPNIGT